MKSMPPVFTNVAQFLSNSSPSLHGASNPNPNLHAPIIHESIAPNS